MHYRYTTSGGTETLYAARIELEEHDGTGWVTTTLVDDIVYAPGGRVRGYVAGEVTMEADWDYAGQLERIHYTKTTGGASLFDWDITSRDGNGNILEVGDTVLAQTYELKYDDRDRLRSSLGTNLKGYQDCSWTYDGAGNRLSEACYCPRDVNGEPNLSSPECKTLTYDYETGTNKLQKIRRTSGYSSDCQSGGSCTCDPADGYGYNVDAAGRSGTGWENVRDQADGYDLIYDDFDRLSGLDLDGDGTADSSFSYDHRQMRLTRTQSGVETQNTFFGAGTLLSSRSGSDQVEMLWLAGQVVGIVDNGGPKIVGLSQQETPVVSWEPGSGDVWRTATFEPFGRSVDGLLSGGFLGYPGQLQDFGSSLAYNHWRYYDTSIGRYTRPDPQGLGGWDFTLYSYAFSNPIRITDPSGLEACFIRWDGYPIQVPGTKLKLPLWHAGVVAINPESGRTRYFEYGRYGNDDFGRVRERKTPRVVVDQDGRKTDRSFERLLERLRKKDFSHGGELYAECHEDSDFRKVVEFAENVRNDEDRAPYSWNPLSPNTCLTFASDAVMAGFPDDKKPPPWLKPGCVD